MTDEKPTLHYFALDGNYGLADGLVLIPTDSFSEDDWTEIENAGDSERAEIALNIMEKNTPSDLTMTENLVTIDPTLETGE